MKSCKYEEFVDILGWTKPSGEEIQEERDALMRSEYFDSIENFPDRIDQFLDAINRVNKINI
jgi:hypothetical protein